MIRSISNLKSIDIKMYISLLILLLILTDIAIILDIFLFRQILGFLYFTIVPGLLILQILRLYDLEFSKKFVLSVGLSISSLMFVGLTLNCLYPLIKRPLSFYPILISLNVFVIVLAILTYWRNKKDFNLNYLFNYKIDIKDKYFSPMLFSFLFPFLSVFGTYLMNTEGNNIILLIMLFLIPIYVATLICLRDKIPETTYPVAIWMIGLSLALMYGLRSNYVSLSDGCIEYYLFQLTLNSSYWRPLLSSISAVGNYSVCLSITILPVIYKIICNLQSYYIFKLYYNIILSITPLAAYVIFRKIFNDPKNAFIASFFFVSQYPYISMLGWIIFRQIIAILFFALIILIIIEDISDMIRRLVVITFITSMVFSHYSTVYVFFIILLLYFISSQCLAKIMENAEVSRVSVTMVVLVFALTFFWYGQISGAPYSNFIEFLKATSSTLAKLSLETFKTSSKVFIEAKNVGYALTKYIYDVSLLFIVVGVLTLAFRSVKIHNLNTYKLFVFVSFGLLVPLVILGEMLKGRYGYDRVYQQLLILLSPAFVLGIKSTSKFSKINRENILLIVMVTLQFLASTYIILQCFGVHHSEVLNNEGIRYEVYYIKEIDYTCAKWIYVHRKENANVWGDYSGKYIYSQFDPEHAKCLHAKLERIRGYIYLRSVNILNGYIYTYKLKKDNITIFMSHLVKMNKIYDNGAVVYSSSTLR